MPSVEQLATHTHGIPCLIALERLPLAHSDGEAGAWRAGIERAKGSIEMIRNLRILGLAFVAIFALSAVAASADEFTAESYPVTLTATHESGTTGEFVTTSGSIRCPDVTYHGTASSNTTTITLTPNFNSTGDTCVAFGALPVVVDVNGCDFLIHVSGGASTFGTADLTCPAGKEVTITVNENTANTLTAKCTIHIPAQQGLNNISFTGVGAGTTHEIRLYIESNNMAYTHTSGSGLGACTGGALQHSGIFENTELITSETDAGSTHVGLFLSNL